MRIKRHVLEAAAEESGIYDHHDLTKGTIKVWDFFRTGYVPYSENSREGRWGRPPEVAGFRLCPRAR
jgi:hypothetical protein